MFDIVGFLENLFSPLVEFVILPLVDFVTDLLSHIMFGISNLLVGWGRGWLSGSIQSFNAAFSNAYIDISTNNSALETVRDVVNEISDNAIIPVAGLILTYTFVYNIITLLIERNNLADFDFLNLVKEIFKIYYCLLITLNARTIMYAFLELGVWMASNGFDATAIGTNYPINPSYIQTMINDMVTVASEGANNPEAVALLQNIGTSGFNINDPIFLKEGALISWAKDEAITSLASHIASGLFLRSLILSLSAWVTSFIIKIVLITRIIKIYILICFSPIPIATFLQSGWVGQIGQTFIKNVLVYTLQGLLIILVLRIMGALFVNSIDSGLRIVSGASAVLEMTVLMVCTGWILLQTENISRTVLGM